MRARVESCTRRQDGKYLVVIFDRVGGRNKRQVLSDWPVNEGEDALIRDGKVIA